MVTAPTFYVLPGDGVHQLIEANRARVFDAVEAAYRLHAHGASVNPDSYFLRYKDRPNSRIIALPAHLGGDVQKSGIKWVSSFPDNIASNLARASAVLILNDAATGYPVACLEASLISATRTAASAALAAEHLTPEPFEGRLTIVGTGVIGRTTVEWLMFRGWKFSKVNLFDLNNEEAERFGRWLRNTYDVSVDIKSDLDEAVSESSLVLFTTTALEPYVSGDALLTHSPTVLHLSLRDISEDVILASQNIVDDVEHCLKARTSVHLTEMSTGNRHFIAGTLVDVLDGNVSPDPTRARIFSPFGLGVLDIAVGSFVLDEAKAAGTATAIPNFFSHAARW
ncbi:MAG: 2,3-diaminopropionate biosynthesis protein SbnB [Planctomycetes bacterium]|jgi:ornithine cyclodeaminase|nr:2,3-diaminopropionate biosynthesis protein SbnB [Planctomycetota bacterium]